MILCVNVWDWLFFNLETLQYVYSTRKYILVMEIKKISKKLETTNSKYYTTLLNTPPPLYVQVD